MPLPFAWFAACVIALLLVTLWLLEKCARRLRAASVAPRRLAVDRKHAPNDAREDRWGGLAFGLARALRSCGELLEPNPAESRKVTLVDRSATAPDHGTRQESAPPVFVGARTAVLPRPREPEASPYRSLARPLAARPPSPEARPAGAPRSRGDSVGVVIAEQLFSAAAEGLFALASAAVHGLLR
jgi:hypothetical protein